MGKIRLIIMREFKTRVRKRSFIVMTLLGPLLMAGLISTILWLGLSENEEQRILVVDQTMGVFADLKDETGIIFDHFQPTNVDPNYLLPAAQDVFEGSGYTAILFLPRVIVEGPANSQDVRVAQLFFKKQPSSFVQNAIETKLESQVELARLERLFRDGLVDQNRFDIRAYKQIKADVFLETYQFNKEGEAEQVLGNQAYVGMFFGIFIYIFITVYGLLVMRGVIEEKSNRIIEVMVSSVKPFQLMMGKIVGIGLVAMTQFFLWIIFTIILVGSVQWAFFPDMYDVSELTNVTQTTREVAQQIADERMSQAMNFSNPNNLIHQINFPMMLSLFFFYFIGGYLLYSSMFAAVGAAVDSETDTQQFMIPLTLPLTLAYFIAITLVYNPASTVSFWFSMIPFTSPVVMLVRASGGIGGVGIDWWELILSMSLLILTFLSMTWLSSRIYRTGILMYGKKPSYRELLKWIRY